MAQSEHDDSARSHAPRSNSSRGIGLVMALLAFATLAVLMVFWAQGQIDQRRNPNRDLQSVHTSESIEVTLQPTHGGHYIAGGTINGRAVTFLLDTGASQVAIPQGVADELGLSRGAPFPVNTANGVATAYTTEIDQLGLGDIVLSDVSASITPGFESDAILLGMSALSQLDWQRSDGELTLRYRTGR